MSKYYTIQDVAEKTGKSQKTVRRHIAAKKLNAARIQNKWRILPEDYKRWVESGDSEEENDRDTFAIMGSNVSNVYKDEINWIDVEEECVSERYDGWKHSEVRNGYNFVDLFSGAGGLSRGFMDAGYDVLLGVDFDDAALKTFQHRIF